jgi:hypothetical protein
VRLSGRTPTGGESPHQSSCRQAPASGARLSTVGKSGCRPVPTPRTEPDPRTQPTGDAPPEQRHPDPVARAVRPTARRSDGEPRPTTRRRPPIELHRLALASSLMQVSKPRARWLEELGSSGSAVLLIERISRQSICRPTGPPPIQRVRCRVVNGSQRMRKRVIPIKLKRLVNGKS